MNPVGTWYDPDLINFRVNLKIPELKSKIEANLKKIYFPQDAFDETEYTKSIRNEGAGPVRIDEPLTLQPSIYALLFASNFKICLIENIKDQADKDAAAKETFYEQVMSKAKEDMPPELKCM